MRTFKMFLVVALAATGSPAWAKQLATVTVERAGVFALVQGRMRPLAELHQGDVVWVSNEPTGAWFRVALPMPAASGGKKIVVAWVATRDVTPGANTSVGSVRLAAASSGGSSGTSTSARLGASSSLPAKAGPGWWLEGLGGFQFPSPTTLQSLSGLVAQPVLGYANAIGLEYFPWQVIGFEARVSMIGVSGHVMQSSQFYGYSAFGIAGELGVEAAAYSPGRWRFAFEMGGGLAPYLNYTYAAGGTPTSGSIVAPDVMARVSAVFMLIGRVGVVGELGYRYLFTLGSPVGTASLNAPWAAVGGVLKL